MLLTGCILSEPKPEHGFRISTMSRHTLDDGKTSDFRIMSRHFDLHLPQLGPSAILIGLYKRGEIEWSSFAACYRIELETRREAVKFFARIALSEDVSFLCIEDEDDKCHRRILANYCKELYPLLLVGRCS